MDNLESLTSAFLGRNGELDVLRDAWRQARAGKPQMRVVVADSGYGKTKLVQALFAWMSQDDDPENFWPQGLMAAGRSLRVMPDLTAVHAKGVMPWFWWGVRWPDPDGHNALAVHAPLLASISDPAMQHHVRALSFSIERRAAIRSAGVSMGKALLGLVPGAETASQLLNAAFDVLEARNIAKEYRAKVELADQKERSEAQATVAVMALFTTILEKVGESEDGLPMVLFLDDAQWMDGLTTRMLSEIWGAAVKRNWPLLVVATHWHREWFLQNISPDEEDNFSSWFGQMNFDPSWVINLGRLPEEEMRSLLYRALPGLSKAQRDHFLRQASGNPRYVVELAAYLHGCPEKFIDGDPTKAMKDQGFASLERERLTITGLEERRFNEAIPEVKKALGLSSLQGNRFIAQFTLDLAKRAAASEVDANALRASERPYVLTDSLPDQGRMEFRSRAIHGRSSAYASDEYGERLVRSYIATVRDWVDGNKMNEIRAIEAVGLSRTAINISLAAGSVEDAIVLVDFLIRKMVLVGDFGASEELLPKMTELAEHLYEEEDFERLRNLVASSLRLMDVLQSAGYPIDLVKDAKAARRNARESGAKDLGMLAARIHVQALTERGEHDRALRAISEALDGASGLPSLDGDRLVLLTADSLLAQGKSKEAARAYMTAAERLEETDDRFGAFHHSAVAGALLASMRCMEESDDPQSRDDVKAMAQKLEAFSMARLLAGSIPYAGADGPYAPDEARAPKWVEASVRHDYGMAQLAKAICLPEGELQIDALRIATESFEKALEIWRNLGLRPDLMAWTILALAVARLAQGQPHALAAELEFVVGAISAAKSDAHPEVAVARQLVNACRLGESTERVRFQMLTYGWMGVDYDLLGPPKSPLRGSL